MLHSAGNFFFMPFIILSEILSLPRKVRRQQSKPPSSESSESNSE